MSGTRKLNAFEINTVGLAGQPFPFCIQSEYEPPADNWRIDTWAVQLRDVVDLITASSGPYLVVYDVGHYESSNGKRFFDLATLADQRSIPHRALDVEWASYRPSAADDRRELIVIPTSALMQLVGDLGLYELSLLSVADQPDDDQLERMILDAKLNEPRPLASVPDADLALNIHDDCYLHVEARRREQIRDFGGRVLALFAETVARRSGHDMSVTDPPVGLQNALIDSKPAWTADPTKASVADGNVIVPLAQASWRLGEALPHTEDAIATYDAEAQTWAWSTKG